MNHTIRNGLVIIIVGVVLPFGMLYWAYDGQIPWLSGDAPTEVPEVSKVDPEPRDPQPRDPVPRDVPDNDSTPATRGNGSGAADVDVPQPANGGSPVHERGYTYAGVLRDRLGVIADEQLTLVPASGEERVVHTRDDGAFSFVAKPQEYPMRMRGPSNETILRVDYAPSERLIYLNLTLTRRDDPEYAGLLDPAAASAEQELQYCRVRIYGKTLFDPTSDTRLYVRLLGGNDKTVSEGLQFVDGSQILGEVTLRRELPYSGFYKIEAGWKPAEASATELARITTLLGGTLPQEGELRVQRTIYLGRPQDEELQEKQIADFYEAAIDEAYGVFYLVHKLARELRGERRARIPSEYLDEMRNHSAYAKANLLIENPNFPIESWRRFVDKELPAQWRNYLDTKLIPYREKYPKMAETLKQAFRNLSKFKKLESQLYYRKNGLTLDTRDKVESEHDAPSEWRVTRKKVHDGLNELRRQFDERRRRR